tara:strand:+ start:1915 stop:2031 length:117 start_codon:yes stop_codon:yes gene_type:complete
MGGARREKAVRPREPWAEAKAGERKDGSVCEEGDHAGM